MFSCGVFVYEKLNLKTCFFEAQCFTRKQQMITLIIRFKIISKMPNCRNVSFNKYVIIL